MAPARGEAKSDSPEPMPDSRLINNWAATQVSIAGHFGFGAVTGVAAQERCLRSVVAEWAGLYRQISHQVHALPNLTFKDFEFGTVGIHRRIHHEHSMRLHYC